jgi:hypothetical protein
VHVSKDGGKNWENITPKGMPEWMMINSIEPHPTLKGGCYIAGTRYKSDDFQPYLYKTTDYGKTWTKITQGIPADHFTRVLRADPVKAGLLYAGTEMGVYVSFNDGASWQPLQLNLPVVPITDLHIKENDLIAATQGRSYWILDNLSLLHQLSPELKTARFKLYQPEPTYHNMGGRIENNLFAGQNPHQGVAIHYYLAEKPDSAQAVTLELTDMQGNLIKKYSSLPTEAEKKSGKVGTLEVKKGANLFVWNMRYPDAARFEGIILWFGGTRGPEVVPGKYQVKLTVGEASQVQEMEILKDPRLQVTQKDLEEQFAFLLGIRNKLTETHEAIGKIREVKATLQAYTDKLQGKEAHKPVVELANAIRKDLSEVEATLYQVKNRSGQDPLNYPIRLNNRLSALATMAGYGYSRPTDQMYEVEKDITEKIDGQLQIYHKIIAEQVPRFNALVQEQKIPAIMLEGPAGQP